MHKPAIPIFRRGGFSWQPPLVGIPARAIGGLSVKRITTVNFIAGAVISLGILPNSASGDIHNEGLHVYSVRNDSRNGQVINFGIPPSAKVQTTSPIRGIYVYSVRNDRRDGYVITTEPPTKTKLEPHIIIFRKPLTAVSRFRPWFGQLPPIDIVQSDARNIGSFIVVQRFNEWPRPGRVVRTGPRFTGTAINNPGNVRSLSVVSQPTRFIPGRVINTVVPRSSFFIAVNRVPTFTVTQNRSKIDYIRARGSVYRFLPHNHTIISFSPINIVRGYDLVIHGQTYQWSPKRLNFIPPALQVVPKPIKIFSRYVGPIPGYSTRWEPTKETISRTIIRGLRQSTWRYVDTKGRVIVITPLKRNPVGAGSLNHGLVKFSNFRISLSVKRENDGGKADVFSADTNGTVISFNKSFKIVESITVTPLTTALQTAIYNFDHTTLNPTTFLVKLFDNTGARINGTVSWKARGIL